MNKFMQTIPLAFALGLLLSGCDAANDVLKNPAIKSATTSMMLIKNSQPVMGDVGTEVIANGLGFATGVATK